jgi:wyosine [tRNA(Phe)-imidazoG37] synthetase (radical SAM superfamily)
MAIRPASRYAAGVTILNAHQRHPRNFAEFRYVYPVLSRRSHGISIGLNTNPNKVCNFDCLYCQVDRTTPSPVTKFDLAIAETELREILNIDFSRLSQFAGVPAGLLHLHDIALSGDAEPTALRNFSATVAMIARVKPPGVKIILITDAGGLDRPDVKKGLVILDANDGEVWAKLDAGTADYYRLINRSKIPFTKILKNIAGCAKERSVIIQSLFLKILGAGPSPEEITAYCDRLREIGHTCPARSRIKLVQVCTIARRAMTLVEGVPAWKIVTALSDAEVDAIRDRVTRETGLPAESFYGR